MKSLKDGDLSAPNGILDCTAAAYQLQRCVRADIHAGKILSEPQIMSGFIADPEIIFFIL